MKGVDGEREVGDGDGSQVNTTVRLTVNVPSAPPGFKSTILITSNTESARGAVILDLLGPSLLAE